MRAIIIFAILAYPIVFGSCNRLPEDNGLTKLSLWREINKYPFADAELVMKSAILESGYGLDSRNVVSRNNLFGMKCNLRGAGCQGGYAVYDSWQESVKDRYLHEARWLRQGEEYCSYLNRNWGYGGTYCELLADVHWLP